MAPVNLVERSMLGIPDAAPFVVYRDVHKRFADKVVLDGLNLEVKKGETLVLLGRSGTGKSVALKLILGLIRPERGEVSVAGRKITGLSEKELARIRRHVGMVFQGGALFDSLSVCENVAYGLLELYRWPLDKARSRVEECLELVDLHDVEDLLPGALSGGMAKRVAIARAIASAPELLLYDEPTTGLDPATTDHVNDLIKNLQAKLGVTSIVVTHDLDSAFIVADRIALLEKGRVAWIGPAHVVKDDPPDAVARFLGNDEEEEGPWRSRASLR